MYSQSAKMQLLTIPVFKLHFTCSFFSLARCKWPPLWPYLRETEPPGGSEAEPFDLCKSAESQHGQPKPPSPPPEPRHHTVQPPANGAKSCRSTEHHTGHSGQPAHYSARRRTSALRPDSESGRTSGGSECPSTNRPGRPSCFRRPCCSGNPSHPRCPSCSAYHHRRGASRSAASALPP